MSRCCTAASPTPARWTTILAVGWREDADGNFCCAGPLFFHHEGVVGQIVAASITEGFVCDLC